jgi:prevent-host-death family protein
MAIFTIRAAKANLSELIERAEAGEEIIIGRRNKPVARLIPVNTPRHVRRQRAFGILKGKLGLPDSLFFDPLPEEEQ